MLLLPSTGQEPKNGGLADNRLMVHVCFFQYVCPPKERQERLSKMVADFSDY